jgi:hypothetical protein
MKYIYFSLPIDEDTNVVIPIQVEKLNKTSDDSFNTDVTMEQLIDFRDLPDEVIEDNDKSSWL